ncbi:MAG: type II toxin-antitoxin system death-on-curing family toxin [Chitinophagales bacterium]
MVNPRFLTLAEVVEIHKDQIERYGGHLGVRDYGLLGSAVAAPAMTFDGNYLYKDLFEMAVTYVFHICQNHPFFDGNKRTALASGLVFLELNGITIIDENGILYLAVLETATGNLDKSELERVFRDLIC